MASNRSVLWFAVLTAVCSLALAGCGGGGSSSSSGSLVGILKGTVYAPDGSTPVEGATVYVPGTRGSGSRAVSTPEPAVASTLSGPDGGFELTNVPQGMQTLKIVKGAWSKSAQVNVVANQTTTVPAASTTLPTEPDQGAPKIAVVQGAYDRMEDVLAKLGMGQVDQYGQLVPGTEKFDLYDYNATETLFTNPTKMAEYDIIFLNCGCNDQNSTAEEVRDNLRNYVNAGGRLYATDWAYNYVEQAFPAFIDFYGSDDVAAETPERYSAAKVGTYGITTEATILDNDLKAWLGNFKDTLNQDETVHIAGFLGGWVVISGVSPNTKVWVQGNVEWSGQAYPYDKSGDRRATALPDSRSRDSGVKPLTVTFDYGQGQVLYTSYHTEDTEDPGLLPQERILAYLVFEIIGG